MLYNQIQKIGRQQLGGGGGEIAANKRVLSGLAKCEVPIDV